MTTTIHDSATCTANNGAPCVMWATTDMDTLMETRVTGQVSRYPNAQMARMLAGKQRKVSMANKLTTFLLAMKEEVVKYEVERLAGIIIVTGIILSVFSVAFIAYAVYHFVNKYW